MQWRHIDVAVFRALPRTPENCHLVIEAKRLGAEWRDVAGAGLTTQPSAWAQSELPASKTPDIGL